MHIPPSRPTPPSCMWGGVGCVVVCVVSRRAQHVYTLTYIHIYGACAYHVAKYILYDTNIMRTNRGGVYDPGSMFFYI